MPGTSVGKLATDSFTMNSSHQADATDPTQPDHRSGSSSAGSSVPEDGPPSVTETPIRILIAKPGLDGHDRGAKVMVRALRDAGFEVIYTGLFQTAEMIASAALQEDVDVVGLSILSGAHMTIFPRVVEELRSRGLDDILIVAGGTIPKDDLPAIREMGVSAIFGPGTNFDEVVRFIHDHAPRDRDGG